MALDDLDLPVPGADAGTWGTKLNNALKGTGPGTLDGALSATYAARDRLTAQQQTTPLLGEFRRRLATRHSAGVDVLAVGDSLTEGQSATAIGNRWVARLRDALRNRYQPAGVTGGIGYLPGYYVNATIADPFTLSGSAVIQGSQGLGRRSVRLGTTAGTMTSGLIPACSANASVRLASTYSAAISSSSRDSSIPAG